jgi:tetratricopeptide (TPR) repeat protein
MENELPGFLDVPFLIEASEPRPRLFSMRMAIGSLIASLIFSFFFARSSAEAAIATSLASGFMLLAVIAMAAISVHEIRAARAEGARLEAIEELLQLRRWPEAAINLQLFLSRPARSPAARAQALLFLTTVLMRYHRFEDSLKVYDYLLEELPLDDAAQNGVQLGRAMALLREDNLYDADRAIAELRRANRGNESPGLALVEIYRDVKTGHPAEAIEMFEKRLGSLRKHMGHRLADAWALASRAYDLLGREAEAITAYQNATCLSPLIELQRRYPEILPLAKKFLPAPAPVEVA